MPRMGEPFVAGKMSMTDRRVINERQAEDVRREVAQREGIESSVKNLAQAIF